MGHPLLLGAGQSFVGGGVSDPSWASVVLLAINDNAADATTVFDDQATANHTLTATGNAQYDTAQAPTGMTSSGLFDGTGDRVTSADAADLEPGTSDMTVEFMFRANTVSGTHELVGKRTTSSFAPFVFLQSGTSLLWYASSGGGWDVASASPIGTIAVSTWYHVALTRSGTTFRAFLDGAKNATEVTSAASLLNNTEGISIGGGAGAGDTDGWISNMRYTIGVARYTADFTPPTLPLPTS